MFTTPTPARQCKARVVNVACFFPFFSVTHNSPSSFVANLQWSVRGNESDAAKLGLHAPTLTSRQEGTELLLTSFLKRLKLSATLTVAMPLLGNVKQRGSEEKPPSLSLSDFYRFSYLPVSAVISCKDQTGTYTSFVELFAGGDCFY